MTNVQRRFTIIKWIPRILMVAVIGFAFYVGWKYKEVAETPKNQGIKQSKGGIVKGEQRNIDYSHFDKGKLIYKVNADTVFYNEIGSATVKQSRIHFL